MRKAARKAYEDIAVIARSGGEIATLAPLLCRLTRGYVGAAAVALFWMDEEGRPVGFHHEDSPAEARDLFANEFHRLFVGPDEINVASLSRRSERNVGHLIAPPASYYRSNTYNLLVRPSGHHHALDLRVDISCRARIVVLAFREHGRPFGMEEARLFQGLEAILASASLGSLAERWIARSPQGHLVVDADARTIRFLDAAGAGMLAQCSLVGQGVRLVGTPSVVPHFIADLCRAARNTRLPASGIAMVPVGRLAMCAQEMTVPSEAGAGAFIVTLEQQVPLSRAALDMVMETRLSPTQKHLLVAAARGQRRNEAAAELGVSPEALKKHLAVVYSTLDLHGWDDIADRVRRHAAP
ncbi:hypothetical protein V5F29_05375 [Xanthobacter aminoxidans]|uniref:hypothetical protein n=1 Tax=Xanthobacter aminoxidans TaxID=186280 RepID=UPI00372AA0C8